MVAAVVVVGGRGCLLLVLGDTPFLKNMKKKNFQLVLANQVFLDQTAVLDSLYTDDSLYNAKIDCLFLNRLL